MYNDSPKDFLSVGPPVYFVVNNTAGLMDFSKPKEQNLVCSSIGNCSAESLTAQVFLFLFLFIFFKFFFAQVFDWQKQSHDTKIATVPLNWMNDYINWIHDDTGHCCDVYNNNEKCISDPADFYEDGNEGMRPSEIDFR